MNNDSFYTKFITGIEQQGYHRRYHIGPHFIIDCETVEHDLTDRNDLMNRWKRDGYINETLRSHISIFTYYTDDEGNCYHRYNCTVKIREQPLSLMVNFDYLREATPANEAELVAECIRRAVEDGAI